jgi:hypothetical protein
LNLEDAFIEYTRDAQRQSPLFTGKESHETRFSNQGAAGCIPKMW